MTDHGTTISGYNGQLRVGRAIRSTWRVPGPGSPTRNVAGDALVSTSSRRDAGYQGDNAVDGFIGIFNPILADMTLVAAR